jgi:protein TonB
MQTSRCSHGLGVRMFIGMALGALFLLMDLLVRSGPGLRDDFEVIGEFRFGPVRLMEVEPPPRPRIPQRPPVPEMPPLPPQLPIVNPWQAVGLAPEFDFPELGPPLPGGDGLFDDTFQLPGGAAEGDIVPVVIISPVYPREALIGSIEGWVGVEFMIAANGTVRDARVVDAEPARIFDREAIRAIVKWKFKPRVVDGVPVARRATQTIEFRLDDEVSED